LKRRSSVSSPYQSRNLPCGRRCRRGRRRCLSFRVVLTEEEGRLLHSVVYGRESFPPLSPSVLTPIFSSLLRSSGVAFCLSRSSAEPMRILLLIALKDCTCFPLCGWHCWLRTHPQLEKSPLSCFTNRCRRRYQPMLMAVAEKGENGLRTPISPSYVI